MMQLHHLSFWVCNCGVHYNSSLDKIVKSIVR